jgi:hypothetical protein
VLIGFSPAGCTSIQNVVTLGYEYRLFWQSSRRYLNEPNLINVSDVMLL